MAENERGMLRRLKNSAAAVDAALMKISSPKKTARQAERPLQIIRTYNGVQRAIRKQFDLDARRLAQHGYEVTSQSATPGHKSPWQASWAVKDQLVVTYSLREAHPPRESEGQPASGDQGVIAQLERLADLRERGALTQEEFDAQKRKLIG